MTASRRPRRGSKRLRWVLRQLEHTLAAMGVLFLVSRFVLDLSVVVSPSMTPTLQGTSYEDGDWLVTERISYRFREPRRWEVITYRANDGCLVSKRVVGLPGEAIALSETLPLIDGRPASRPDALSFLTYFPFGNLKDGNAYRIGEGYFVLGDDSKDSQDSRYEGELAPRSLVGRAFFIAWPPERIGFVQ